MSDIYLEGSVGGPFWPDDPHFTAADLRARLRGQGDVTVHVNSGGGIASEGLAIHHMLRDHPGKVAIVVTGEAVSAASLLVMAGDTITMRAGTSIMIHDPAVPFTSGRGTEQDHREVADYLRRLSDGYAEIYAARAGISPAAAREIMRAETWYTPAEAIAAGFADAVSDSLRAAASRFPYDVYHHAPERLLAANRTNGPSRKAVLAMMCGAAAPQEESAMTVQASASTRQITVESQDAETPATVTVEEEITDEADSDLEEEIVAQGDEGNDPAPADEGAGDEEENDEDRDAVAVLDLVALHGGTVATARKFIADGTPLSGVIAHYRMKGPSVTNHKPGGSPAHITRDERDTRRIGMTEALAAQIGRRAPTDDRARPFMAMTLPELAALSNGNRRPLRSAADKQQVFMDMHSTSDFPISLGSALNKELQSRYAESVPVYRALARVKNFRDFRPHPVVRPGDFPMLQAIGENGEIKYGTIGEKGETVALMPYAVAVSLSRQVLINDDIGAIADMVADQGRAAARFEEKTFFEMMLGGANADGPTLTETTRQVFNTTDGTKAVTAAAITVASLSVARAAILKRKSVDGNDLSIMPKILLVGPDKLTEAESVVAPITPDAAGNVNPFAGRLQVVVTPKITGNAWYLLADPADAPNFVYGYLDGAAAPRTRIEEPFGRQGTSISIEHDFGVGAIDFRAGFKNAGA